MARVLIAEDSEADRHLLASIVGEAGHELVLAKDGDEALRLYTSSAIDVVVTDIMMAGTDGVELILALKAVDPDAAVIAVSGKGPTGLHFAQLAGAVEVITKPIDPTRLVDAVEEAGRR